VHFGATELGGEWLGYIEGACESGERAAREVLRDDDVVFYAGRETHRGRSPPSFLATSSALRFAVIVVAMLAFLFWSRQRAGTPMAHGGGGDRGASAKI
jgi:hypothetical protein